MQKHSKSPSPNQCQNPDSARRHGQVLNQGPSSARRHDQAPEQGSGSANMPAHSNPIQIAVSGLKPGPDAFRMSDGDDNPFKELKIFPEDIWGPSQQDSGETDSKLLIGRTVDGAFADFHAKLKSLRGKVSDTEYAALEKKLEDFRVELGALVSSNAGTAGNNQPNQSLFKAATTYTHNGRTVNVGILRAGDDKVNFLDAHRLVEDFNRQHNTNVKLITPHLADAMLNDGTDAWRLFYDNKCYPFPTNAFVAYEAPGKKLGKEIVFSSENNPTVRLLSTGRYAGSKGIALFISDVTSHDLQVSGSDIILDVPESRIQAIDSFPSKDGWYLPDPATTIPHGNAVKNSASARYLWRQGGSYVGPAARGYYSYIIGGDWQYVYFIGFDPSFSFGVAVEYE